MSCLSRVFSILLVILLAASSLILLESASAQSMPKPSLPEFTIEMVGPPFDIPPSYSFNFSNGLFNANNGYHIKYSTVNIVIKNQPFSNQTNLDYFYYNVRIKPHNYPDSYWHELFYAGVDGYPVQTQSDYTVIPLSVEGSQANWGIIPAGETTDIQVDAMIGHIGRNQTMVPYPYPYVFFGVTSGWSSTQTVTLPEKVPFSASSTQLNPSPTESQQTSPNAFSADFFLDLALVAVAVLVVVVISLLLYVRHLKRSKIKPDNSAV